MSSDNMDCQGMGKVVAFPLAPTRCRCMCTLVWNRLPYFTSKEKQIMEVMHGLAQIISMTVIFSGYSSRGA